MGEVRAVRVCICVCALYKKGEGRFARIDLSKYLIRYIGKRFLTVSIDLSQSEGLKIPVKSIVEKYFYVVPKEFIVNDQGKTGITVCELDETNTLQYRFCEAEVYYYDDDDYNQQIANAIQLIEKDQLIKDVNAGRIVFLPMNS